MIVEGQESEDEDEFVLGTLWADNGDEDEDGRDDDDDDNDDEDDDSSVEAI